RRRHTRSKRDWSSDVCSSDLIQEYEERIDRRARELHAAGKLSRLYEDAPFNRRLACICRETMELYPEMDIMHHRGKAAFEFLRRSEERRVGQEGRAWESLSEE